MKRILITGASGYIGTHMRQYLAQFMDAGEAAYQVDTLSLRKEGWENHDFTGYDSVLHLAGKAHADISRLSEEARREYKKVNCELAVRAGMLAREAGVPQFIYMSSVIVYGDSARVGKTKHITASTQPAPSNFYGDSKWQAEQGLCELKDAGFQVACVRSPMVYGPRSKGNFPMLVKLAEKLPCFPKIQNERSMIYIDNLTEFLRQLIESGRGGVYLPQNAEYATTAMLVERIAAHKGRKLLITRLLNPFVFLTSVVPGRVGALTNKAFGSLTIEQGLTGEIEDYRICDLEESLVRSLQ